MAGSERGSKHACPECGQLCKAHDFREKTWRHLNFFGSSAEFVGSRGGFEANDQVCPVGVEHPTRSLRRWSCEAIINSEGTKWDAAQDYPEPGAE
ncbi:transposase family protein, partial [Thiolapillus sp.]